MPLTEEQINSLKEQLREQVADLSEPQKSQALEQIESMSTEALEIMLKQSKEKSSSSKEPNKSIFRSIIDKETPSVIADENSQALAVLSIRSISEGHCLVIPKKAAKSPKDLPAEAFALAKKIAKRAISNLKAKSVEIQTETSFGEAIINVIPIYGAPLSLSCPRTQLTPEKLEPIAKKLMPAKKPAVIKLKKASSEGPLKLPRRIP